MPDILGIGSSGLTAYRKLLETVGSNIVNANTEGYVRRDVSLQATGESTMLPTARPTTSGSGVLVDSVRRGTDAFLQAQTYSANSIAKQASTFSDSMSQLEKTVFTNSSNLSTEVQTFYSNFSQLATSPTSTSARLTLLDSGERVASIFRSTASQIQTSLQSADSAIDAALAQINVYATQLARLNTEIARASTGGQKPNDLLDQRDKLLQSLSDMAGFTMVEATNGTVDIYLGDTASGKKLVGQDGAHQLGAIRSGTRLDLAFDPNTNPSITSQIKSGTVAGLLDFRREATVLMQNVDRLAVGFVNAVNSQHMQGVDADGQNGKALFSAESLTAQAGSGNSGNSKMTLSVSTAAALTGASYTARFDAEKAQWTVTASDGRTASGLKSVLMDGVTFNFEGSYSAQDVFTAEPLRNAASGMRFLRKVPSEIAAALPLYVDQGTGNQGSGVLSVTDRNTSIPPAPLPTAADIFSGTSFSGVNFLRNGAAFVIQAGTGPSELTSLGTLSALRFTQPASDLLGLANRNSAGSGGLSLSFTLDSKTNDQTNYRLDLLPIGTGMDALARAINEAAKTAGLADEIFASVSGGALSINGLGTHTISDGTLDGFTAAGVAKSITATTEPATSAAAMRLFTRDGRQLTGPAMTVTEAAAFLTTANGFLSDAFYRPPIALTGYRGLDLSTASDLLSTTLAGKYTATIDVTQSSYNQVPSANGQGLSAGAIYAMDVTGLPPIRLAGDMVGKRDAAGIADALSQQMNSYATRRSWLGSSVTIQPDGAPLHFTVTVDGEDHQVTFVPGKKPQDAPLTDTYINTGTFQVSGRLDLGISLVPDPSASPSNPKVRVMISAPQVLRTGAPTISISADGSTSTKLGLTAEPNETRITAAEELIPSLLKQKPVDLNITVAGVSKTLHIADSVGRDGDVSWSVMDGKLQLTSPSNLTIVSNAASAKLGFATGQTGTNVVATNDLASSILTADPIDIVVASPNGPVDLSLKTPTGTMQGFSWSVTNGQVALTNAPAGYSITSSTSVTSYPGQLTVAGPNGAVNLTIDNATGTFEPLSWSLVNGRLSLSSGSSQLAIVSNHAADRNEAARGGFYGTDLDIARSSQITGSTNLLPALISARKPSLHLSGSTIGDKTITINAVAGQAGGISWSVQNGKLIITSADPTMKIVKTGADKDLADMLGFDGTETSQNGTLTAGVDLTRAMLIKMPVRVTLADGSDININDTLGRIANGGSWAVVDGRLRISSPYLAATVAAGNKSSQDVARTLGFLGPDRDTPGENSVIAAASLDASLIVNRAPQLHIKGAQVGDLTLSISSPAGSTNGVSWSIVNGRLQFTSTDPTVQIVTTTSADKDLAKALGFGGQESFDGSGALIASNLLADSMLATSPAQFGLADGSFIKISAPNGQSGATSWSLVDGRLKITGPSLVPGLQRNNDLQITNATQLGFGGNDLDILQIGTQIRLTSTATDDSNDLVDTRASQSMVANRISIGSVLPEDMIVQVNNDDVNGLRRIAAQLGARDSSKIPFPNITVKILSSNQLEIIDRKSGVSLANRTWLADQPVSYLGLTFAISGNAIAGDVFDISNDATRSGDSRNAQKISTMATASIFGDRQGSFQDVYTSVAGTIGSSVNSAQISASSAKQSASDLKSAYEAKTGVNLDTEASDLIRYQQAYQAAAQVISSARTMFETILRSF